VATTTTTLFLSEQHHNSSSGCDGAGGSGCHSGQLDQLRPPTGLPSRTWRAAAAVRPTPRVVCPRRCRAKRSSCCRRRRCRRPCTRACPAPRASPILRAAARAR
jgi:hypothetical protein